jgi:hypothetical protein
VRIRIVARLLVVFIGAGLVVVAVALPGGAVDLTHRRFVPGLAADSAPAPTATATPTPIPGPGSGPGLYVALFIDIDAKELAVSGTGTTIVPMSAFVLDVPLPTAQAPMVTAIGTFTIAPHPDDHPDGAVCTWTRFFASDIFGVTFNDTGDLSVMATLQAPEWHYTMTCQSASGSTPPVRFPAFGEEGLFLFLQEAMAPYRQGSGVRIPMDAVSGSCIKRQEEIFVPASTGDVTVKIWVYTKPCLLPL